MNDQGHILTKKLAKCKVSMRTWFYERSLHCIGDDILACNGLIESCNDVQLFDMKKFQSNISEELENPYPDRKKLEYQCISLVCLGDPKRTLLENSCWIMIINIVALEMIKLKFNPNTKQNKTPPFVSIFDVSNETMFQDSNIIYKEPLMSLRRSNATKKWTHSNLNFGKKFQRVKKVSRNNFILPKFDYEVSEHGINQNVEKQRGRSMKFVKTFMFMHRYFSLMNF